MTISLNTSPVKFAATQVAKAPVQKAKANFEAAESKNQEPAIQDSGRGFGSFLKSLFRNMGSWFNKKGKQLDVANADANLIQEMDNIKGNVDRVKTLTKQIKAQAIVAQKKYEEALAVYNKEKGEAIAWAKKYQQEQDTAKKADYKKIAEQEAMEWKEAEKKLNETKADVEKLGQQAEAADAQKAMYEKQAIEMTKKLQDGRNALKRAEVKEKMGELQNALKEAAGQGLATSHTSELLEAINLKEAEADAGLGDQKDILEKKRLQDIKDSMEAEGALGDALKELLGGEAAKTEQSSSAAAASSNSTPTTPVAPKSAGESALDELQKMTNKNS